MRLPGRTVTVPALHRAEMEHRACSGTSESQRVRLRLAGPRSAITCAPQWGSAAGGQRDCAATAHHRRNFSPPPSLGLSPS